MNFKGKKWKLQTFVSAPFYKWIVCRSLVRFLLNRQCSGKSRDFRLGASFYYLVGETALSWGGAVGHFGSWPMEGQSSTSRSGWGHHRGPVSTGGVFSRGGEWNSFVCFPPNLSVSQTVKIPTPTSPLVWRVGRWPRFPEQLWGW